MYYIELGGTCIINNKSNDMLIFKVIVYCVVHSKFQWKYSDSM